MIARNILSAAVVLLTAGCATGQRDNAPSNFRISGITVKAPAPENFSWQADDNVVTRPKDCSIVGKSNGSDEYSGYPEDTVEECEAAKARLAASGSGFRDDFEATIREDLQRMAGKFSGEDELKIEVDVKEFLSVRNGGAMMRADYRVVDVRTGRPRMLATNETVLVEASGTKKLLALVSGETEPDPFSVLSNDFAEKVCRSLGKSISACR